MNVHYRPQNGSAYRSLSSHTSAALGFGFPLSLLAGILINGAFSYPSKPRQGLLGWLPDPFFRIWIRNIRVSRCRRYRHVSKRC